MTSTVTAVSLALLVLFAVVDYFSPAARARRRINRWQRDRLVLSVPNRRK